MRGEGISRRQLIQMAAVGAGAWLLPAGCSAEAAAAGIGEREALAWEKMDGGLVHCTLCPRECIVRDGQRGYCEVRENRGGAYRTLVYGRACAAHVDPIEKKPLFHFLPGTTSFSIATAGCNVECQFCQNWDISQARPEDVASKELPPAGVVGAARRHGCASVAFTYSEPTVFYEYTLDTAVEGRRAGMPCVTISNGYIKADPMKRLCEALSAVKVDLKGFTEEFYRTYVRGELKPVLETIKLVHSLGKHQELVTLLIPGLNDGEQEVRELSRWVVDNVGPDVPMHFSRFRPAYKMTNLPQTPTQTVVRARQIALAEGVHYTYAGNIADSEHQSTRCHSCKKTIIERYGYHVGSVSMKDGACAFCGTAIPGVWQ